MSAVAGVVEQVSKLVTVRPLNSRYSGEIGDVVVGRITEVGQRRWKVDVNARQDGVLLLSSVNLPGGVQVRGDATRPADGYARLIRSFLLLRCTC